MYFPVSVTDIAQRRSRRRSVDENTTQSSVDVLWDELQSQVSLRSTSIYLSSGAVLGQNIWGTSLPSFVVSFLFPFHSIVSAFLSLVDPAHQLLLPLAAFKCDVF